MTTLHTYVCKNCRMAFIAGMRAIPGHPYKCKLCGTYMKFAFEQAVESPEDQQLAAEVKRTGGVWTLPVTVVEVEMPPCALCGQSTAFDADVVPQLGLVCQRQACQTKLHGDHGRMRLRCLCGRTLAVWLETMAEFSRRGAKAIVDHVREHVDERRPPAAITCDCTTCGAERMLATDGTDEDEMAKVLDDMEWVQHHLQTCRTPALVVPEPTSTVH